ncbi:serine protease [Embleya sp. NBC_00888]|uniref:trypsin-like serine peptidase n=1 Tax=Embleya sp. NBC_00888 TaxID=2975960 RepID=UPI0038674189|nr:serine protease [Embleya sp. NBC_00888]
MARRAAGSGSHNGKWVLGSGFLMRPGHVVTAAHNLGSGEVTVRFGTGCDHRTTVVYDGRPDDLDLAILRVDRTLGITATARSVGVVRIARVHRDTPVLLDRCWAVGYPQFVARRDGERPQRDTVQVNGVVTPASRAVSGLLRLQVAGTPSDVRSGSQWQGMSGAVVFTEDPEFGNIAVGIVTEHGLDEGPSALTVLPFTAVAALDHESKSRVWALLGIPDEDDLPVLPRPYEWRDPGTLIGAATLLDTLSAGRGILQNNDLRYIDNSQVLRADFAAHLADALERSDPEEAISEALAVADNVRRIRDLLRQFNTASASRTAQAIGRLDGVAEDYNTLTTRSGYVRELRGRTESADASDNAAPAVYEALLRYLAACCAQLAEVRAAVLHLVTAVAEEHPALHGDSNRLVDELRYGLDRLHEGKQSFDRAADVLGNVAIRSGAVLERHVDLERHAQREDGETARLLGRLAADMSPSTWLLPPAVGRLATVRWAGGLDVRVTFSDTRAGSIDLSTLHVWTRNVPLRPEAVVGVLLDRQDNTIAVELVNLDWPFHQGQLHRIRERFGTIQDLSG